MTTVDTAAARRARSPFALSGIAFLIAFGLAGCETGSDLLGSSSSPSPTAVAEPSPTAPPQAAQAKIAIAPIIGAPDAVAKQIQRNSGTAVETQRITVATQPGDKADYTLRGYIVAAQEKTGVKVSYIWDVTDPAGKRVNRITGEEVVANAGRQGCLGGRDAAGRAIDRRQDRRPRSLPGCRRRAQMPLWLLPARWHQRRGAVQTRRTTAAATQLRRRPGPTTGSIGKRRQPVRRSCRASPARRATAARR